MEQQTRNIVIGVAVIAGLLFLLLGRGGDRGYYCVQAERGVCIEYEVVD